MASIDDILGVPVIGNVTFFVDIDEAIEKYNKSTDFLEKLGQLKYIYEKFFDYLNLEKNDGVLLALLETSTVFVKNNFKLEFDSSTYELRCPFYQGDRLLFRPFDKNNLYFSCYCEVAGENVSNVLKIDGQGMKGSSCVVGKKGRSFSLNFNQDGTVNAYNIVESDNKGLVESVKTTTHCYDEGFIKIVYRDDIESQFYDFEGNKIQDFSNFEVRTIDFNFNIIHSPLIPYFGRHLGKQAKIELDEKMISVLFPELVGKFNQK